MFEKEVNLQSQLIVSNLSTDGSNSSYSQITFSTFF